MDKFTNLFLLFIMMILLVFPSSHASAQLAEDEEMIQFIQAAFEVQVSLSEMERSMPEIIELLSPYFTESAREKFINENIVEENGRYFTLGTDFPLYYIPFFDYEDKTEVIRGKEQIYIVEFFPKSVEGPVQYDAHYEGVLLEKEDGLWKVAEFHDDLSPIVLGEQQVEEIDQTVFQHTEEIILKELYTKSSLSFAPFLRPLADFYHSGYSICNSFFKLSKSKPVITVSSMTMVGVE